MIFLASHLSLEENFGKLEFTTVNFIISQHLQAFLMRLVVIVTKKFFILYNKMSQHSEDLNKSVNQYIFPMINE